MSISNNARKRRDSGLPSVVDSDWSKSTSKRVTFGAVTEIEIRPAQRRQSFNSGRPLSNPDRIPGTAFNERPKYTASQTANYRPLHPLENSSQLPPAFYSRRSSHRDHRPSILDCYRHVLPLNFHGSKQRDRSSESSYSSQSKRPTETVIFEQTYTEKKIPGVRYTYVILEGRPDPKRAPPNR